MLILPMSLKSVISQKTAKIQTETKDIFFYKINIITATKNKYLHPHKNRIHSDNPFHAKILQM